MSYFIVHISIYILDIFMKKTHFVTSMSENLHVQCTSSCSLWLLETSLSQMEISCHNAARISGHQI